MARNPARCKLYAGSGLSAYTKASKSSTARAVFNQMRCPISYGSCFFVDSNSKKSSGGSTFYLLINPSKYNYPAGSETWLLWDSGKLQSSELSNSGKLISVKSGETYKCYNDTKKKSSAGSIKRSNAPGYVIKCSSSGTNSLYQIKYPELHGFKVGAKVYVYAPSSSSGSTTGGSSSGDSSSTDDSSSGDGTTSEGTTGGTTTGSTTTEDPGYVGEEDEGSKYELSAAELDELDDLIAESISNSTDENEIFGVNRIIGSPFQFLDTADYRVATISTNQSSNAEYKKAETNALGRTYIENIVTEAPIVYFMPGEPAFLAGMSKHQKAIFTNYINGRADDDATKGFSEILKEYTSEGEDFGRYYDFRGNYAEYMRYVNLLCRAAAIFIGIGDRVVPNNNRSNTDTDRDLLYKNYNWEKWANLNNYAYKNNPSLAPKEGSGFSIFETVKEATLTIFEEIKESLLGDWGYFKCYVDPNSSVNESTSNETTTSKFASLFDTAENLYKEAKFLTSSSNTLNSFASYVKKTSAGEAITDGNFSKLLGLTGHVLSGSNVIFPDIWNDSSTGRSYSFNINLVSPYADIESIYLYTIMPMMHLLALALPRQTSSNSFSSPFIIRAFAPGFFSCDMGIVDSISITKAPNGGDAWNVHGLPSEVQVSLSVKDMYTNLMMSSTNHPIDFMNNQGLIDFLGVICGLNFSKPTYAVKWEAMWSILKNSVLNAPDEIMSDLRQTVSNKLKGLLGMK